MYKEGNIIHQKKNKTKQKFRSIRKNKVIQGEHSIKNVFELPEASSKSILWIKRSLMLFECYLGLSVCS